jgi:hypothetical protein
MRREKAIEPQGRGTPQPCQIDEQAVRDAISAADCEFKVFTAQRIKKVKSLS